MMRYTARDDWQLDQRLLPYDLRATKAHVNGLLRAGALPSKDHAQLVAALDELLAEVAEGRLQVQPDHEDCHTTIEAALTQRLGDAGKRVHLGRSRNDQVLVALRLYERDAIDALIEASRQAGLALLDRAETEANTPMVGYTHLQRAVPSSIGLWLGGIAEALAEGVEALASVRRQLNKSPLGTAAGYGVNIPLDREGVARELGFDDLIINPGAAQISRGVAEVGLLSAAWQVMAAIRRFAWDISLYTTSEFGTVQLETSLTTGSSIMPNKRNPDVVELMRAACGVVQGAVAELFGTLSLPSGYQRDVQLTKAPLMRALDETLATTRILKRVVEGIRFDRARMRQAISPETYATDRAVELAASGLPFRDAYRQVATEMADLPEGDPEASLKQRSSPGGGGDLRLDAIRARFGD